MAHYQRWRLIRDREYRDSHYTIRRQVHYCLLLKTFEDTSSSSPRARLFGGPSTFVYSYADSNSSIDTSQIGNISTWQASL